MKKRAMMLLTRKRRQKKFKEFLAFLIQRWSTPTIVLCDITNVTNYRILKIDKLEKGYKTILESFSLSASMKLNIRNKAQFCNSI